MTNPTSTFKFGTYAHGLDMQRHELRAIIQKVRALRFGDTSNAVAELETLCNDITAELQRQSVLHPEDLKE